MRTTNIYTTKGYKPLQLVCSVFPKEVPRELGPLSFHKLCVDMHLNETKFKKKRFSRVLSHDLYWENQRYKLRRSIALRDEKHT